mmetsp:Transcript_41428/g.96772  ORF Transcript_41428/g.96772 Transcript_41428/m.96772 type:complete len:567 (-) Transcript_41428:1614-3314(-)
MEAASATLTTPSTTSTANTAGNDAMMMEGHATAATRTTPSPRTTTTTAVMMQETTVQQLHWFSRPEGAKGPQQMMFEHADAVGNSVFVAQDSGWSSGRGTKEYASLQSHMELAEALLHAGNTECCIYELIREGWPCSLYLDLEWESSSMQKVDAHRVLSHIISELFSFLQDRYKITPRLSVLDGSRVKTTTTKYSYHVCACNVAFSSNFGGMKSAVEDFASEHASDPLFFSNDKPIIDPTVYTKNRCFRTPLSHKKDDPTRTKLQRIAGRDWEPRPFTSAGELLDALVTYVPDNNDEIIIIPDPPVAPRTRFADTHISKKRRIVSSSLNAPFQGTCMPSAFDSSDKDTQAMQELLDEKGIKGFKVVGATGYENGRTIYRCRNDGERRCLSNPTETHTSNNPYLQLEPDGTVLHYCHACTCKDLGPYRIGRLGSVVSTDVPTPSISSSSEQGTASACHLSTDSPMSGPFISSGGEQDADGAERQHGLQEDLTVIPHDVNASIGRGWIVRVTPQRKRGCFTRSPLTRYSVPSLSQRRTRLAGCWRRELIDFGALETAGQMWRRLSLAY